MLTGPHVCQMPEEYVETCTSSGEAPEENMELQQSNTGHRSHHYSLRKRGTAPERLMVVKMGSRGRAHLEGE